MELEEQIKLTNRFANKSKELQDRIDKAIEYIEEHFLYHTSNDKKFFEDNYIQELNEILKGE